MQDILYFACNVTPKQHLEGAPRTGWELLELVLSRYYAQGARLRTCFNPGSRRSHGAEPKLLSSDNEIDWTHAIGHFQLFEGPGLLALVITCCLFILTTHMALVLSALASIWPCLYLLILANILCDAIC